jgi:hypothetical protein
MEKVKMMPKRTNEFQQLIYAINLQLAKEATVTESKLLRHRLTGAEREVDVAIEFEIGPYQPIIGIECRAHRRPQDVEWIEQAHTMHEHLTDKLVLVSKSGFTPEAKALAKTFGIETLTLAEAEKVDWTQIVGKLKRVYIALVRGRPAEIRIFPKLDASADVESLQFYDPDGTLQGSPFDVGYYILSTSYVINYIFTTFLQPGDYTFSVDLDPAERSYLKDKSDTRYSVEKLQFILSIHLDKRLPVDLQHRSYKDAQVAYGTLEHPEVGGQLTIVETSGKPLSADLALKEK